MPKNTFHPEELSLLAAIHAEPREDTPRLVLADWLQEHDQEEYAQFIRLQCESYRMTNHDPEKALVQDNERQLLKQHGDSWIGPTDKSIIRDSIEFERGLPQVIYNGDKAPIFSNNQPSSCIGFQNLFQPHWEVSLGFSLCDQHENKAYNEVLEAITAIWNTPLPIQVTTLGLVFGGMRARNLRRFLEPLVSSAWAERGASLTLHIWMAEPVPDCECRLHARFPNLDLTHEVA